MHATRAPQSTRATAPRLSYPACPRRTRTTGVRRPRRRGWSASGWPAESWPHAPSPRTARNRATAATGGAAVGGCTRNQTDRPRFESQRWCGGGSKRVKGLRLGSRRQHTAMNVLYCTWPRSMPRPLERPRCRSACE
eukprot:6733420-Prymnesium_polylepis.2